MRAGVLLRARNARPPRLSLTNPLACDPLPVHRAVITALSTAPRLCRNIGFLQVHGCSAFKFLRSTPKWAKKYLLLVQMNEGTNEELVLGGALWRVWKNKTQSLPSGSLKSPNEDVSWKTLGGQGRGCVWQWNEGEPVAGGGYVLENHRSWNI